MISTRIHLFKVAFLVVLSYYFYFENRVLRRVLFNAIIKTPIHVIYVYTVRKGTEWK
jgi:hypothetical protein